KPVKSALGGGTDSLVAETLKRVEHQSTQEIELFGRGRVVDFSQFKPRGHYTKSERLQCYFRAMMWCGRIDFEVGSEKPDNSSIRELAGALVLHDLLKRAKKEENWRQFDQFIRAFVGPPDSMNFDDLQRLARSQKMADLAELKDASALFDLQQEICRGDQGRQAIAGSHRLTGSELPRSWTFLGQRFVIDSWAMGKVVEDQLELNGKPVPRRIASAVDVAFMVLGNNSAAPILAERIRDPNGRRGRDGLQFQHHATAVRNILDRQSPSAWEQNLYWGWLGVLRELSVRSHDGLPEVMRTEAWEMKNLSSQLASWTQLRHDTILYADQVMVSTTCCYPSAFVEPRVDFWRRFETMARRALDLVNSLSYPDITLRYEGSDYQHKINGAEVQKRHAEFFENFASRLATLRGIAGKEIGQQALTAEETKFLQDTISVHHTCAPRYSGWYPELFFKERKDCATWDALVADVLTVPPDAGDPGCILHQGVGNVDMMLIAIDNGGDKAVYAGPVFSYYEFETAPDVRKTDAEWRKQINEGKLPARPAWTAKYLAPGSNPDQANYRNEEDWGMTREEFERITRQIK
ncbi:MAG TPA: DUF3160 domain-containing protein, partial [Planctomycetota bacterium]|nr:DUF3160 domain-containing protein [Planctomycetota bacterium]